MKIHKTFLITIVLVVAITATFFSDRATACSPDNPESFDSFVKKFMTNKGFSTARTIYPNPESTETEDEEEKRVVTKEADARQPTLSEYIGRNHMEFRIEDIEKQRATLHIYAPNTGYSIRYHFIMKRGCWFLKSRHVVSM